MGVSFLGTVVETEAYVSVFSLLITISREGTTVCLSCIKGHPSCLQFGAVTYKTAINIHVQVLYGYFSAHVENT